MISTYIIKLYTVHYGIVIIIMRILIITIVVVVEFINLLILLKSRKLLNVARLCVDTSHNLMYGMTFDNMSIFDRDLSDSHFTCSVNVIGVVRSSHAIT